MMDRVDISGHDKTMMAVVTTGNGGFDKLEYRAVPIPRPKAGEVLLRVLAAGVNNTEINTRLGWYSSSVTESTDATSDVQSEKSEQKADGGWNEATPFPFIQGTDCCGRVAAVGEGVDATRCHGSADCQEGVMCLTHDLWDELSHEIDGFLDGITLGKLVARTEVRDVGRRQDNQLIQARLL